jgi:N-dimethylarginine dimethylaminohydrolase
MNAPLAVQPSPRLLMCRPRHFAVSYSINPWMDPAAWAADGAAHAARASRQWSALHRALRGAGARIDLVAPQPDLPDLVFTANAAVVLDGTALLARFRHPERRGEEPVFAAAFRALKARGLIGSVVEMPDGVPLEGAGDCIWDAKRSLFWMGHGPRSDAAARHVVEDTFGVPAVALPLADPHFYHLDTAFCALPCGAALYYPGAFTAEGLASIHQRVAPADRIALDRVEATRFAANAVHLNGAIVMSSAGPMLRQQLEARGYRVIARPLDAFLKSGGSACCLTLRLDHRSQRVGAAAIPEDRRAAAAVT